VPHPWPQVGASLSASAPAHGSRWLSRLLRPCGRSRHRGAPVWGPAARAARAGARRAHPARGYDADHDRGEPPVQPPYAVRGHHLPRDLRRALCGPRDACVSLPQRRDVKMALRAAERGARRTQRPGGAPSSAICRVLMTDSGYRHVVRPCAGRGAVGRGGGAPRRLQREGAWSRAAHREDAGAIEHKLSHIKPLEIHLLLRIRHGTGVTFFNVTGHTAACPSNSDRPPCVKEKESARVVAWCGRAFLALLEQALLRSASA